MLLNSLDRGITHFDLANNYGPPQDPPRGTSARSRPPTWLRTGTSFISTKAGYLMWDGAYGEWGSRECLISSLDQSLERMGLEYVGIFYSHRVDPSTPHEETMGALDSAVRAGKALYAGISSYGPDQTRAATAILKSLGTPCLIHQPSYSMLNRRVEEGLLDVLEEDDIGCIAFSPLAQGLPTDKYHKVVPKRTRAAIGDSFSTDLLTEQNLANVRALNEIAAERGQTLAQMAVAWVLRDPRVTSALVGASRWQQIDDLLNALENTAFTDEELTAIWG